MSVCSHVVLNQDCSPNAGAKSATLVFHPPYPVINSPNKEFIQFKLCAILSSTIKPHTTLLSPTQNANHPSGIQYPMTPSMTHWAVIPAGQLAGMSVLRKPVVTENCSQSTRVTLIIRICPREKNWGYRAIAPHLASPSTRTS